MQKTFHCVFLIVEKKSSFRFLMMVTMLLFTLLLAACGNSGGTTGAGSGTPTTNATGTSTPAQTGTTAPASSGGSSTAPSNTVPAKQLQFTNIRMVSTSIGWGLTKSAIYKTVDGGHNWYNAGPANTQIKNPSGEFLNANDAWIVQVTPNNSNANAFQVIRTTDGGKNWQTGSTVPAGPSLQDYPGVPMFINLQNGWIEFVTNGGPGAGSESVAIFRTTDGGKSWTKVTDTTNPNSGLPNGGLKSGISFKDAQNGWATGRDASSAPWLYVTHDGGASWKKQALPGATDATASYLTTPPVFFGNKGVLPVSISLPNGTETAIYTTSDGGETWTAPQAHNPFSIDSTNDIYVADQTHAWAINSKDKQLYITSSINLQTWQPLASTSPYKFVQLSFVDASNGWAIGGANGNALLRTLDGGRNWNYE